MILSVKHVLLLLHVRFSGFLYATSSLHPGVPTFCTDVLSSARQVARFLAHWPSCMAAAWSVTVGTADLVEVTILLPGCGVEKEKEEENNYIYLIIFSLRSIKELPRKQKKCTTVRGRDLIVHWCVCGDSTLIHQL